MKEEMKNYLMQTLRINADIEEGYNHRLIPNAKRLVITLSLGGEVINETKLWI